MTSAPARAARRYDPERKSRIIDATLTVIAEFGVAGTTHRRIAVAADVPLGSLTYHFSGLEDLLEQAFTRHAERMSPFYESHFDAVRTQDDLIDAITGLIHELTVCGTESDAHDWAISYELYLAALRDPALRQVTESWMRRSRAVLERFVDPLTARGIDAAIEGLVMHMMPSTVSFPYADTRVLVQRLLGVPQ